MSDLNILMITARADFGGGPEHVFQLANKMRHKGNVWIAAPQDVPYFDRYSQILGADRVIPIPHRKLGLDALMNLRRKIQDARIDVIHSHGKGAGLYARLLALMTSAKSVHTFHGIHVGQYSKAMLAAYLAVERRLSKVSRRQISVSASERQHALDLGIAWVDKTRMVYYGVTLPDHPPAPRDRAKLRLVSASRFDVQKNTEMTIEVAQLLAEKMDFELTILGDGEGRPAIEQMVRDRGLADKIRFTGSVSNPRDYFAQAHIYLSTARWEGMPIAVLEAMSEGCCSVLTRVIGHTEMVVQGENGYLYDSVEEAVERITGLWSDYDGLEAMSNRAYQRIVAHHSLDAMANNTFDVYQEALS